MAGWLAGLLELLLLLLLAPGHEQQLFPVDYCGDLSVGGAVKADRRYLMFC